MDKDLLIALALIGVVSGLWILWALRRDNDKARRQSAKKALEATRRNEADRRRQWVAKEAKEEARRLKHARRHRRAKIY